MRLLTMAELTALERRLVGAVVGGERLDLIAPDEVVDADAMAGWGEERTVRCELVRSILLDRFEFPDDAKADPRGIWLRGARLAGTRRASSGGSSCARPGASTTASAQAVVVSSARSGSPGRSSRRR